MIVISCQKDASFLTYSSDKLNGLFLHSVTCTLTLPKLNTAGYLNIPVEPFVPNPLRCFKCQKYGHGQNTCHGKLTCTRCSKFDHDSKTCKIYLSCTNCKGHHFVYLQECPRWQMEKRVQQVRVREMTVFS